MPAHSALLQGRRTYSRRHLSDSTQNSEDFRQFHSLEGCSEQKAWKYSLKRPRQIPQDLSLYRQSNSYPILSPSYSHRASGLQTIRTSAPGSNETHKDRGRNPDGSRRSERDPQAWPVVYKCPVSSVSIPVSPIVTIFGRRFLERLPWGRKCQNVSRLACRCDVAMRGRAPRMVHVSDPVVTAPRNPARDPRKDIRLIRRPRTQKSYNIYYANKSVCDRDAARVDGARVTIVAASGFRIHRSRLQKRLMGFLRPTIGTV
jgi:hypothetical protein